MRALVSGGSGFIASHLIPALVEAGWEVQTFGRRDRPPSLPPEADYARADLANDHDDLDGLFEGVTHLFHLAGASSSKSDQEEMERSNIRGTSRLMDAARRASKQGLERVLHMSSTSVYGEEVQLPSPVPEHVKPQPSRGYGKAKWGAEEAVWRYVADGFPAAVLRPVSVYGPGNTKLLASAILDAAVERFAGSDRLEVWEKPVEQRLLHVDDLVAACLHLVVLDEAMGRAFNVTAPDYPSSQQLAGVLAHHLGMELDLADDIDCGLDYDTRSASRDKMLDQGMKPDILLTKERLRLMRKENRNNRLSLDALLGTGFQFTHTDLSASVGSTIAWYESQRWIL